MLNLDIIKCLDNEAIISLFHLATKEGMSFVELIGEITEN
jgi:hypothetical protein